MTSLLLAATTVLLASGSPSSVATADPARVAVSQTSFQLAEGATPKADGFITKITGKWLKTDGKESIEITPTQLIMSDKDLGAIPMPLNFVEETDTTLVAQPTGEKMTMRLEGDNLQVVGADGVVQATYTRQ